MHAPFVFLVIISFSLSLFGYLFVFSLFDCHPQCGSPPLCSVGWSVTQHLPRVAETEPHARHVLLLTDYLIMPPRRRLDDRLPQRHAASSRPHTAHVNLSSTTQQATAMFVYVESTYTHYPRTVYTSSTKAKAGQGANTGRHPPASFFAVQRFAVNCFTVLSFSLHTHWWHQWTVSTSAMTHNNVVGTLTDVGDSPPRSRTRRLTYSIRIICFSRLGV